MTARFVWRAGCMLALVAVAAGAFATHGLRGAIPAERLAVFETAARYQMYHALALLVAARAVEASRAARWAAWLFVCGIVVFSGTLYLLALSGVRWLGAITPVGGVAFLAGWIALAAACAPAAERAR